jgi:hypothetical protein
VTNPAASPAEPGTFSLTIPPLFAALAPARNVLIAGAGGGFDVYAGLPLALALWRSGEETTRLRIVETRPLEVLDLVGMPLPGHGGHRFGPALVAA